jgi:hypothetical protein
VGWVAHHLAAPFAWDEKQSDLLTYSPHPDYRTVCFSWSHHEVFISSSLSINLCLVPVTDDEDVAATQLPIRQQTMSDGPISH